VINEALAFWTVGPGAGELRIENVPDVNRDHVLIHTLYTGVSRGTEALVFAGKVPPSQFEAMRAPLMGGSFPFPVKYGYSAVGRDPTGARQFVLHPHQNRFIAPRAMCVPVPDAVPSARAVLAANMETALNIVWDAAPLAGERILVIGAGVVGLLTAYLLARIPATQVSVCDIDPGRGPIAERFGCRFCEPHSAPFDQELIVHASGSEAGLRLALDRAAVEARIVEASWFGDKTPALPLGEAFHARRLRIVSSQVGRIAPAMRERRNFTQRLATALSLLTDPDLDALLDGETPFERLPEEMPRLLLGGLCHVVTYGETGCTA
jgi:threonine dehydrogenase-like Zn-dependent dehydrogenase